MIRSTNGGARNAPGGNSETAGVHEEEHTKHRSFARHFTEPFARFEALPDLFRRLAGDISSMLSLQVALLKAEIADGMKGYTRGAIILAAAALPAVLTLLFLEAALACFLAALFPFRPAVSFGIGCAIVMLLNALVAAIAAWVGVKEFRKHSLVPRRSIEEIERDKQWLTSEVI